jgi:hypothetical protein
MEWEGIHDTQVAEIEIMPEERPLFDLIPADRRDTMAPLIHGVLSNIHAQIGDDAYAIFCADMKRRMTLSKQATNQPRVPSCPRMDSTWICCVE